jgi:hypothetical protein
MIALMAPRFGSVNWSNFSGTSSKEMRWVIQMSVLILPWRMRLMISGKSEGRALREARKVGSRRWKMGACGRTFSYPRVFFFSVMPEMVVGSDHVRAA